MNTIPLHPLLVHFPLALAVLLPLLQLVFIVAVFKSWLPARSWLIIVLLQALLVGSAFVAKEFGEEEEHAIKKLVPKELWKENIVARQFMTVLKEHEESAEVFFIASIGVFVLGIVPLLLASGTGAAIARGLTLLASLVLLILAIRTGASGGSLVYNEGAAQVRSQGFEVPAP